MARENTGSAEGPLILFCERLGDLQRASGAKRTSLAAAAKIGKSQMSAILNGDIKRTPRWNVVRDIVDACLAHAKKTGHPLPIDLRDVEGWKRRYFDLENDLEKTKQRRKAVAYSHREIQVAAGHPVKTVRECDPFDLEVRHAVSPAGTVSLAVEPESLTPYLKRDHDEELRASLRQAANGGPSVFAVLAGDSSTGKTRALYEALHEVVPGWPLLRPADADELLELLRGGRFRDRTVLWLNETHRHLYGIQGEYMESKASGQPSSCGMSFGILAVPWP